MERILAQKPCAVMLRRFEPFRFAPLFIGVVRQNFSRGTKRGGFWWVVLKTTIDSMQREDFEEGEPACAWSTNI